MHAPCSLLTEREPPMSSAKELADQLFKLAHISEGDAAFDALLKAVSTHDIALTAAVRRDVLNIASDEIWEEIATKLFDVKAAILALITLEQQSALDAYRDSVLAPFTKLLYGLNPFEGGVDGDQCIWCHRGRDKNIESWQQGQGEEFHYAGCEFVAAIAALKGSSDAAPEQGEPKLSCAGYPSGANSTRE